MIPRYTRPEMGNIWSDENKFRLFLEIEILACEAQAKLGNIPQKALKQIKKKASFDLKRIQEIENVVKHDVIAFLTNVGEYVGEESRYIHLGMTSSDILDTGLSLQMKQSAEIIIKDLEKLRDVLVKRAREFKYTIMIGRTHGVHAEPITFGLKLALWYDEILRNIERIQNTLKNISVGKISGAVGTYEHIDPYIEEYVCEKLGLKPVKTSTQIIQRDLHAEFLSVLAIIACSIEKFATEIRHLQKTEVLEVEEYFSTGQKGSSAMPHKRNPITCERISGLARVIRANAQAAFENIALWHERDISHSSVERIIIPDSCILLDYMITTFTEILEKLVVYPENMEKNLKMTGGLIFSQELMLVLTLKGMKREDAYALVQKYSMEAWKERILGSENLFMQKIMNDPDVKKYLNEVEIEKIFDYNRCIKKVDYIFNKLGI